MVNFSIEQIREIMDNQDNIRNIVDHGKSTLTDSLIVKSGIFAKEKAGNTIYMDTKLDEQTRRFSMKPAGVSLYYEYDETDSGQPNMFLINLIDSPGHVDFSSEVTAALRITDGALVVVDYVEGVCVQTETVLRQALQELIRPVLMINKVDRSFFELKHDPETIYQNFQKIIEKVNVCISTYQKKDLMGECQVYPENGTVAFGSALHGWGFTINTFARKYAQKFGTKQSVFLDKLWGDNYFNPNTKAWTTEKKDGDEDLQRGMCSMILDPIMKLANCIMDGQKEIYTGLISKLGIELKGEEQDQVGTVLLRAVMQKWIMASDALLEMIILHLPSPKIAQKYRTLYLYEGPMDDECAKAMIDCDPKGPLMIYISKMLPTNDKGKLYAFGRVFSGSVVEGKKVRILGPNYKPGNKDDVFVKNIQGVVLIMGKKVVNVIDVPCGNICALFGIDQFLVKQGTISDSSAACTIRSMKYIVSSVVRIAVNPKNPDDLPKLIDGLKTMAKADPLVEVLQTETGQDIAGCGELHLETCLKDLVEEYSKVEIIKSDPFVPYKETVTAVSSQVCVAKSANKHNRLFVSSEPLAEELTIDIENQVIRAGDDLKVTAMTLIDKYEWDQHDARNLWVFGPDNNGPNLLVDQTKGVQYLTVIKDSMERAFQWVTKEGVLAEENMRGIRFNIVDVNLHADVIHIDKFKSIQFIPVARRVYYAAEYTASPRYQEPVFLVDISTPSDVLNGVYQCLSQRRGVVISEETVQETSFFSVKAYLPVSESFGFTSHLRSLTSGQAFSQCVLDHWGTIMQDPFDTKSMAFAITMEIRKRKGLRQELPVLADYLDKL